MMSKRRTLIGAICLCFHLALSLSVGAQLIHKPVKKAIRTPVIFLDSVSVDYQEVTRLNKDDIAVVSVYKDSNAVRLLGPDGRDGVIFIRTKAFARKQYWSFFSARSPEYARLVPAPGADSTMLYIVDDRALILDAEADLLRIDETSFASIKILDSATLVRDYQVENKTAGILIVTTKH